MAAPLEAFLRMYTGGNQTLSPEMFAHFGGDDILTQLRKYDPNAHWSDVALGGGEGGEQGMGKRLDFDITKMPTSKSGIDLLNMRPSNFVAGGLRNNQATFNDDAYGNITHSANIKHTHEGIDKFAPLIGAAIGMGSPALAGLLAGAGIGGAAGLTSAATGSGLTGLNSFSLPSWLTQTIGKAPTYAGQISKGNFDPFSLLMQMGGSYAGLNPALLKGGMTLAQLARR